MARVRSTCGMSSFIVSSPRHPAWSSRRWICVRTLCPRLLSVIVTVGAVPTLLVRGGVALLLLSEGIDDLGGECPMTCSAPSRRVLGALFGE
jgi:hypothetical protein